MESCNRASSILLIPAENTRFPSDAMAGIDSRSNCHPRWQRGAWTLWEAWGYQSQAVTAPKVHWTILKAGRRKVRHVCSASKYDIRTLCCPQETLALHVWMRISIVGVTQPKNKPVRTEFKHPKLSTMKLRLYHIKGQTHYRAGNLISSAPLPMFAFKSLHDSSHHSAEYPTSYRFVSNYLIRTLTPWMPAFGTSAK